MFYLKQYCNLYLGEDYYVTDSDGNLYYTFSLADWREDPKLSKNPKYKEYDMMGYEKNKLVAKFSNIEQLTTYLNRLIVVNELSK